MPYIKEHRRDLILIKKASPQGWEKMIVVDKIETAGELNYAVTELIIAYYKNKIPGYQSINDISGALTEALAEFRRRVTSPYENTKIEENGDVYPEKT